MNLDKSPDKGIIRALLNKNIYVVVFICEGEIQFQAAFKNKYQALDFVENKNLGSDESMWSELIEYE